MQFWKSAEQIFSGVIGRAVIVVLALQMAIDNQREADAWSNISTLDVSWLYSFVVARDSRLCHSDVPWREISSRWRLAALPQDGEREASPHTYVLFSKE
jgi:hypothetical protein